MGSGPGVDVRAEATWTEFQQFVDVTKRPTGEADDTCTLRREGQGA
ncbi:hypothetical protein [Streptomyces sp. NPDC000410]